jgi:ferredoxin
MKVVLRGKIHQVECTQGETILDAAIRADIDPPYSCLEGTCMACMAVCKSDRIQMPDDHFLDPSDISSGKILTCQAKIIEPSQKTESSEITVNFDEI